MNRVMYKVRMNIIEMRAMLYKLDRFAVKEEQQIDDLDYGGSLGDIIDYKELKKIEKYLTTTLKKITKIVDKFNEDDY